MGVRRASIGWRQNAGVLSAGAVSCVLHAQEFLPLGALLRIEPCETAAAGS